MVSGGRGATLGRLRTLFCAALYVIIIHAVDVRESGAVTEDTQIGRVDLAGCLDAVTVATVMAGGWLVVAMGTQTVGRYHSRGGKDFGVAEFSPIRWGVKNLHTINKVSCWHNDNRKP